MGSKNWKDFAELIGIAAIVISLIFVGIQLQLERAVSVVEARAGLTDRVIYLTEIINDSDDVWKRGLDDEELSPIEEIQFLGMYGAVRSHIFTQWVRWSRIGPIDPNFAAQSFAYAIYSHPGLRRIHLLENSFQQDRASAFDRNEPFYDFVGLVEVYLAELDRSKPVPNKQYIFW